MNNPYEQQQQAYAQPQQGGVPLITYRSYNALLKKRPWLIAFAVLNFVMGGLTLIGLGMALFSTPSDLEVEMGTSGGAGTMEALIVGLPIALLPFFYGVFLLRSGKAIKRLASTQSEMDLLDAVKNEFSFWRLCGIVTAIYLAIQICLWSWVIYKVGQIVA